ncbi:hypothetical protein BV22DRAFT_488762 [Leucogyrophana mollusca]|uniref:Uncharacterized protein n=1 Tax=Leucogyrophana mollusca TaxID=85980 RepID=A0ACB8BFW0_9AGAM|nr:hypothetical protein BV22DRAFT_488762 [Leucogyrophana mollusca]
MPSHLLCSLIKMCGIRSCNTYQNAYLSTISLSICLTRATSMPDPCGGEDKSNPSRILGTRSVINQAYTRFTPLVQNMRRQTSHILPVRHNIHISPTQTTADFFQSDSCGIWFFMTGSLIALDCVTPRPRQTAELQEASFRSMSSQLHLIVSLR